MRVAALAFSVGVLLLLGQRELPDPLWVQWLPLFAIIALAHTRSRVPALVACGFLWALLRAATLTQADLPIALEGQDIAIEGRVASLPIVDENRTRFRFDIERVHQSTAAWSDPGLVQLSWYDAVPELVPGERWRLTVRLKRPHGFMNPGSFDYEGSLFQRGIRATGYVRARAPQSRTGAAAGYSVTRLRSRLADAIDQALPGQAHVGMVKALTIGERAGISARQWAVLRGTGTSHLMAISGLHVGLVAAAAFFLARSLWSGLGFTVTLLAAPRFAALAAITAATVYAGLAGFSIPTQRAVIMVTVVMLGILARRNPPPSVSLAWGLLSVLVLDPFAALSVGFWLSFVAVGVILFGMTGRLSTQSLWWRWGRVQWLVAVGLAPLTLLFFHQQPLVAPLANLVAVPWTGFVVVPGALLGAAVVIPLPGAGEAILRWTADALGFLWPLLEWFEGLRWVVHAGAAPSFWVLFAAAVGVTLILLPRGVPGRWLGLLWLAPLFLLPPARPAMGELHFTLLDVGQGLSAVLRTRSHVLVYDTGPRYGPGFDAAGAVLIPFLRHRGVSSIDTLIVSHGDSDHAGGFRRLLDEMPARQVLVGPSGERSPESLVCRRGQRWRWDEVEFEVLHPAVERPMRGNNGSCVLKISAKGGTVLLPGDIERGAERQLVRTYGSALASDILVAPHHGSATSSTDGLLEVAAPRYALFATGFRNRFGFPKHDVVSRFVKHGATTFDTGRHGAVTFILDPHDGVSAPRLHRMNARRFWHHGAD